MKYDIELGIVGARCVIIHKSLKVHVKKTNANVVEPYDEEILIAIEIRVDHCLNEVLNSEYFIPLYPRIIEIMDMLPEVIDILEYQY